MAPGALGVPWCAYARGRGGTVTAMAHTKRSDHGDIILDGYHRISAGYQQVGAAIRGTRLSGDYAQGVRRL